MDELMELLLEKLLVLIPNAQEDKLEIVIEDCIQEFMNVCNREDVPDNAQSVLIQMSQFRYNLIGTEGLSGQSFSGTSESYLTDWPNNLKRAMYRFRRMRTL